MTIEIGSVISQNLEILEQLRYQRLLLEQIDRTDSSRVLINDRIETLRKKLHNNLHNED